MWPLAIDASKPTFAPRKDGTTFVSFTETGFTGDGDELVKHVTDSTQGFSFVLADLKSAHVRLNLVGDPNGSKSTDFPS
jgi:hypothetical protein